jgi:leader peptidase (prepilin peptidase)/N-methyltransferase
VAAPSADPAAVPPHPERPAALHDQGDVPAVPHPAAEGDWTPPKNAVPYGPFLALAALEYLLAGARIVAAWDGLLRRVLG